MEARRIKVKANENHLNLKLQSLPNRKDKFCVTPCPTDGDGPMPTTNTALDGNTVGKNVEEAVGVMLIDTDGVPVKVMDNDGELVSVLVVVGDGELVKVELVDAVAGLLAPSDSEDDGVGAEVEEKDGDALDDGGGCGGKNTPRNPICKDVARRVPRLGAVASHLHGPQTQIWCA
jgi:hypothetical protein